MLLGRQFHQVKFPLEIPLVFVWTSNCGTLLDLNQTVSIFFDLTVLCLVKECFNYPNNITIRKVGTSEQFPRILYTLHHPSCDTPQIILICFQFKIQTHSRSFKISIYLVIFHHLVFHPPAPVSSHSSSLKSMRKKKSRPFQLHKGSLSALSNGS